MLLGRNRPTGIKGVDLGTGLIQIQVLSESTVGNKVSDEVLYTGLIEMQELDLPEG